MLLSMIGRKKYADLKILKLSKPKCFQAIYGFCKRNVLSRTGRDEIFWKTVSYKIYMISMQRRGGTLCNKASCPIPLHITLIYGNSTPSDDTFHSQSLQASGAIEKLWSRNDWSNCRYINVQVFGTLSLHRSSYNIGNAFKRTNSHTLFPW